MALDTTALAGLSPWQQKVIKNTSHLSAKQRQQQGVGGAWDAYNAAKKPGGGSVPPGTGAAGGGPPRPAGGGGGGPTAGAGGPHSYDDPANVDKLLTAAGIPGATFDERLQNALLGNMFSGVEQFQQNQAGGRDMVSGTPSLHNVSTVADINTLGLITGEISGMLERGQNPAAIWQERMSRVPAWAGGVFGEQVGGDVYGQLMNTKTTKGGLPFSLEYLKDPGINLHDPTKPLFDPRANPPSLLGATGGGQGERSWMSGLSAEEFMRQVNPAMRAQFNQGAGQPAGSAGLMFGAMDTNPDHNVPGSNWVLENPGSQPMHMSPLRGTDAYQRWTAYGQPGNFEADDPFGYPGIRDSMGNVYNPFTGPGTGSTAALYGAGDAQAALSGALLPQHLAGSPSQFPDDLLTSWFGRIGAANQGRPDLYWQGPFAPYAPWLLDPNALARMQAIIGLQPQGGEM